jgi:hypothetical protein
MISHRDGDASSEVGLPNLSGIDTVVILVIRTALLINAALAERSITD